MDLTMIQKTTESINAVYSSQALLNGGNWLLLCSDKPSIYLSISWKLTTTRWRGWSLLAATTAQFELQYILLKVMSVLEAEEAVAVSKGCLWFLLLMTRDLPIRSWPAELVLFTLILRNFKISVDVDQLETNFDNFHERTFHPTIVMFLPPDEGQ